MRSSVLVSIDSYRARLLAGLTAMTALLAVMLIPAAPAAAEEEQGYLTITTSSPDDEREVVAGEWYEFTYEVHNDTGAPLTVDRGAFVDILFAFDPEYSAHPARRDCNFEPDVHWDFEINRVVGLWTLALPTVIDPGLVGECTFRYEATSHDVDYGGLWTMLIVHSSSDWGDWESWIEHAITAPGVNYWPEVAGDGRAGHTLTASTGYWGPLVPPHVPELEYQWYRGVNAIPRATSRTYIPTTADVGEELSVGVFSPGVALEKFSDAVVIEPAGPVVLTDVSDNESSRYYSEFYDEITWFAEQGITTGYSNGDGTSQYRPFGKVTRDAMAAFLYRYAGEPETVPPAESPFVDVTPASSDFYGEIAWLSDQRITKGWDTHAGVEYRPFEPITRDAMAAFLYRYAGEPRFDAPAESPFVDVDRIHHEFYTEIAWLAESGITTGWDTSAGKEFRPFEPITRDAMAAFIYRYNEMFGEVAPELGALSESPEPSGSTARSSLAGPSSGPYSSASAGSCVDASVCAALAEERVKPTGK
ncbi:S-layer homology domain-containing protein [Demequina sp. SO4-13]|uniref:S-layer homology domain-containing protein n=1 Tax=Demequina sp. SO4-13 TaxID=3401027 RepID=UPI003AF528FD